MSRVILVYGGNEALVDDEDYEKLCEYKWFMCGEYVATSMLKVDRYKIVKMHSLIMGVHEELVVDHKDGNELNNTKLNLRVCTVSQNAMNRKKTKCICTSIYKGVRYNRGRWEAYIYPSKNVKHIGSFSNEIAAANAYNYYAKQYFGEFARLNDVCFMSVEETNNYKLNKRKSKFYGVAYHKINKKWTAHLKGKYIGSFITEEQAAEAYNQEAIKNFGVNYKYLNCFEGVGSVE